MKSAKFKDSPLGPIPQDWEVKTIAEFGQVVTGSTPPRVDNENWNGDFPWISAQDFGGKYIRESVEHISEQGKKFCRLVPADSVLVTCIASIGLNAIVKIECATNQQINAVMCEKGSPDFLYYTMEFNKARFLALAGQTAVPIINKGQFKTFTVPCPPSEEQQRIAEALGEVDKLIESLDAQIEKKRLIAKGVAHDLLSGKKRLPGFKGTWREVAFKVAFVSLGNNTYARECLCGDSANAYDIHYGDVLIRFGAVVDFSSDSIPRLKDGIKPNKDFLQDGDIVFADTAEDEMVGKAVEIRGLGDDKAVSGLHTMACRPRADMFAPRFLGYYLNSDSYRKQLLPLITGSKVSSLSRANFESTILTMPDVIEQQAIADLLSEQDAAIAALVEKREKYVRIKDGVMRDLLTGKVRLKGE